MTDQPHTASAHWAVIIGINYYPKGKCLEGAVRDSQTVKHYLEAGAAPVDIVILTATTPSDLSSGRPIEEPMLWPTFNNVKSSFERVFESAKPGDYVYIHYSGHGTSQPSKPGYHSPDELALVLFEHDEIGQRYLEGHLLANAIQKMVKKGLLVTLVLDCCFSGAAVRNSDWHGTDVRSIDYDPRIAAVSPSRDDGGFFGTPIDFRGARMESDWLINPDGYTTLTACGPQELAWELKTGNDRRGALTFFLLRALSALRNSGVEVTHQSLHAHLSTIFHVHWPRQTPMRYGKANLSFFGKLITTPHAAFVPVYKTERGELRLRAGQAHGVYEGDEYAVHSFHVSEHVADQLHKTSVPVKVTTVHGLEADLAEIDQAQSTSQIATGWKAKLITSFSPRKIHIRVAASNDSKTYWKAAAKELPFACLLMEDEDEPCIFNIRVSNREEYEVVDALGEKIIGIPPIPLNSDQAVLRDILRHLTTFKYVEGIENRLSNPTFEKSFSLEPHSKPGASDIYEVKDDSIWGFTVQNNSDRPFSMAIFNFTPSWEIVNLTSESSGSGSLWVPPKDQKKIELQMKVPEFLRTHEKAQCEDIIKVFITSKQTSFPSMVLSKASQRGDSPRVHNDDPLSRFLAELTAGFRDGDGAHGDWTTRNFIVRTVME